MIQQKKKLLSGRQVLRIIFDYYKLTQADEDTTELLDLMNLQVAGDNIDKFVTDWSMMLLGMKNQPPLAFFRRDTAKAARCIPSDENVDDKL